MEIASPLLLAFYATCTLPESTADFSSELANLAAYHADLAALADSVLALFLRTETQAHL